MKLSLWVKGKRGRAKWLAGRIGCTASFVGQMCDREDGAGRRPVPAAMCVAIERETEGQVMRWDLRPLDWHEIWPELICLPGVPPLPQSVRLADAVPHAAPAAKEAACHD